MTWILTASGRHFDFADPQPDQIDIRDICRALSCEARFNGHTRRFYSVAQHSAHVSEIVPPEHALEGLLHDASEAYCKDIPMPLKLMLPDYRAIERRVDAAIRARFGLPAQCSAAVKLADVTLLATERRDLMPIDGSEWEILRGVEPLPQAIKAQSQAEAQMTFWSRWLALSTETADAVA